MIAVERLQRRDPRTLLFGTAVVIAAASIGVGTGRDAPVIIGTLLGIVFVFTLVRYPYVALVALLAVQPFHAAIFSTLTTKAHLHVGALAWWKEVATLTLFLRGVIERFRSGEPVRGFARPLEIFVVAYIVIHVALFAFSPSYAAGSRSLVYDTEGPILMLAIILLRPSRRVLMACAVAVVVSATIIGFTALIERLGPRTHLYLWYGQRPSATFVRAAAYRTGSFLNNPLVLGFYLAVATPFAVGLAAAASRRWRLVAGIGVVGCATGLLLTITRTAYIGGGIGVLVTLALCGGNRRIRGCLVGMLLVVAGMLVAQQFANQNTAFLRGGENTSKIQRLERDALLVVFRPSGFGLGTTDFVSYRFQQSGVFSLRATESTYMAKALEGGVLGLFLYIMALFATAMRARAGRLIALARGDRRGVALAAGAIGSFVAIAGANLFLGVSDLSVEYVLWGAAGIAIAWIGAAESRATRDAALGR